MRLCEKDLSLYVEFHPAWFPKDRDVPLRFQRRWFSFPVSKEEIWERFELTESLSISDSFFLFWQWYSLDFLFCRHVSDLENALQKMNAFSERILQTPVSELWEWKRMSLSRSLSVREFLEMYECRYFPNVSIKRLHLWMLAEFVCTGYEWEAEETENGFFALKNRKRPFPNFSGFSGKTREAYLAMLRKDWKQGRRK